MNKAVALTVCLAVSGCATTGGISWGSYEEDLYRYYHQADKRERVVADFVDFIARVEQRGGKPAPGLYAEAGTFLLLQGKREKAIAFYQKEHEAWPESQTLMSTLINNLQEQ